MISDQESYRVEAWMVTKLGLKSFDLHAFALFYSQNYYCSGPFTTSRSDIRDWLGCSHPTTFAVIKHLEDRELVKIKRANGLMTIEVNWRRMPVLPRLSASATDELPPVAEAPILAEESPEKQPIKPVTGLDIFRQYAGDDEELFRALRDFDAMRSKTKARMTDRGRELLCAKLDRQFPTKEDKIATLLQSIERSYRSVFPVRAANCPNSGSLPVYSYGTEGVNYL